MKRITYVLIAGFLWALVGVVAQCEDPNSFPELCYCEGAELRPGFICPNGADQPCFRDGHSLADPAVFTEAFVDTNTLELVTTTSAFARTALLTEFVAQAQGSPVYIDWPDWAPIAGTCDAESRLRISLTDLLGSAGELDQSNNNYFRFSFKIRVTTHESVLLHDNEEDLAGEDPVLVDRTLIAVFKFLLVIDKSVTVSSEVEGLSDQVLYAMVFKSQVIQSDPARVGFVVETLCADNVKIDTQNLPVADVSGSQTFTEVSAVQFDGYVNGSLQRQRWSFTVFLDKAASCSFEPEDQIRLEVKLVSNDPENRAVFPASRTLFFHSLEGENWCLVTDEVKLLGVQRTFEDFGMSDQTLYFFVGSPVFTCIQLWYTDDSVAQPSERACVKEATAGGVDLIAEPDAQFEQSWDNDGFVCYSFVLADSLFPTNEAIKIKTVLTVELPAPAADVPARRRSTDATTAETTKLDKLFASTLYVAARAKNDGSDSSSGEKQAPGKTGVVGAVLITLGAVAGVAALLAAVSIGTWLIVRKVKAGKHHSGTEMAEVRTASDPPATPPSI